MKLIVTIMYTRTIKPVSSKADTVTWKCPDEIGRYVILRLGFNELVYKIEAESRSTNSESVASTLERDGEITIQNWLEMLEHGTELTRIPLSRHERMNEQVISRSFFETSFIDCV
jgi:hypothetical protein